MILNFTLTNSNSYQYGVVWLKNRYDMYLKKEPGLAQPHSQLTKNQKTPIGVYNRVSKIIEDKYLINKLLGLRLTKLCIHRPDYTHTPKTGNPLLPIMINSLQK